MVSVVQWLHDGLLIVLQGPAEPAYSSLGGGTTDSQIGNAIL